MTSEDDHCGSREHVEKLKQMVGYDKQQNAEWYENSVRSYWNGTLKPPEPYPISEVRWMLHRVLGEAF